MAENKRPDTGSETTETKKYEVTPDIVEAMNTIRRYAADDAHVIFGTAYDEGLGDQLRVTVIATGLSSVARRAQPPRRRPTMRRISPRCRRMSARR